RGRSARTATAILIAATTLAAHPATQELTEAQPTQLPRPVVDLDKTRFTTNERVFFWIGIDFPTYLIRSSSDESCQLVITKPDGTTRIDKIQEPADGPRGRSWRGGHGLGSEAPQVGRYTLVFGCGGRSSAVRSFVVEDLP